MVSRAIDNKYVGDMDDWSIRIPSKDGGYSPDPGSGSNSSHPPEIVPIILKEFGKSHDESTSLIGTVNKGYPPNQTTSPWFYYFIIIFVSLIITLGLINSNGYQGLYFGLLLTLGISSLIFLITDEISLTIRHKIFFLLIFYVFLFIIISQYNMYQTNDRFDSMMHDATELVTLHKYDEAIEAYDDILQLNPNYVQAWNGKGILLHAIGKTNEALTAFDEAIRIDPNYAPGWYNKGNILATLGYKNQAIISFTKASQLNPGDTTYREALTSLKKLN